MAEQKSTRPGDVAREAGGSAPSEPAAGDRTVSHTTPDERGKVPGGRPVRDRAHVVRRVVQVVDYVFYLLYGLLAIRFVLTLVGASESASFVQLVHRVTDPFYAPFTGIVARPTTEAGAVDLPLIVAFVAYIVLHVAVRGLLHLFLPGGPSGGRPQR